jgi:ParB family chromosome partitioning protein
VRQLEAEMREDGAAQARDVRREARGPIRPTGKDADTRALEKRLSDKLGLEVTVDHKASGGGTLHIKYNDLDQLDVILKKLDR